MPRTSPNADNTTQTDDLISGISPASTDYPPPPTTNDSPEAIHQLLTIDKTPILEPQTEFKESYILNLQSANPIRHHLPNTLITPVNSIPQLKTTNKTTNSFQVQLSAKPRISAPQLTMFTTTSFHHSASPSEKLVLDADSASRIPLPSHQ